MRSLFRACAVLAFAFAIAGEARTAPGHPGSANSRMQGAPEIYAFRLPRMGSVLEWVETIPAPVHGQAWVFHSVESNTIWGIRRSSREVVVARLTP